MNRNANRQCCHHLLLLIAASSVVNQTASASPRAEDPHRGGPPPCPTVEYLCEEPFPKPQDPLEMLCECGPGEWRKMHRAPLLVPATPFQSNWIGSENFVTWRASCERVATDGTASANVTITGTSSFWHAGSRAGTHMAQYAGGWTEIWRGTYPACVRSVLLSAVGSGGLGIGGSCAARLGCSASSSATAAGLASSRGNAYAHLTNLNLNGTVAYDNVSSLSRIDGNFGAGVAFSSGSINGTISTDSSWTVAGQGSATGTLSFTVSPNRTYCALTNLPIMAFWTGTVVVTTAVTVDENGTAAGSAGSTLTLSIN